MTQTTEPQPTDTLTLSDIAAEIGFELEETEPTPQEIPDTEPTPDAEPDSSAETDHSQPDDGQEPESEDEKSDDDDSEAADDEQEDTPTATQEKLLRRIDKITAKRREAEEKAETLESEISDLRARLDASTPVQIVPTPNDPLADVETPEQLAERISTAKKVRKWALEHLEGGTVTNAAGEEVYYEPAQVRQYLANADEVITEHAPKRQQWIAQRQSVLPEAQAAYPSLFKAGSQESQVLRETLKAYPALRGMPNLELVIGDAIAGQQLRFARQEAGKKSGNPVAKPEKSTPSVPSAAKGSKVPARDIQTRAASKSIFERGATLKTDDIADFLEAAL
jgi:hypothetical protein